MSDDLSPILNNWAAKRGAVCARKLVAEDGQTFIQMRVDLGVLQMHLEGRPDGEHQHGFESMLALLANRVGPPESPLELSDEEKESVVREMLQYYRRRICLIALADEAKQNEDFAEADACYQRAIGDADHNLSMLDLLAKHCTDAEFVAEHLQYQPFIIMHRTVCQTERALLADNPDQAVEQIKSGITDIKTCAASKEDGETQEQEDQPEVSPVLPFLTELHDLEERIRREYNCPRTLREQLEDAVAAEDYELAARLRDALARQSNRPSG
jgi:hypothetical protein